MKFDIVTIFPSMIEAGLGEGVVSRGLERGLLNVAVHDLRRWTTDRHRTVDDVPYGGGPGMVMKALPHRQDRRESGAASRIRGHFRESQYLQHYTICRVLTFRDVRTGH